MKTDLILTMDEYLAKRCDIPKHVKPPTRSAHHIPITTESDFGPNNEAQLCRCDCGGHPCPSCTEHIQGQRAPAQDFGNKEQR